ncbi:uncharacterized protein LOC113293190 isoform X2 [Papaver somniferum]|uniref:uncharacterized protein LOC113293190 isoform X2 n=1 Tax=Papaver somniferum TaxID=3469 RepID=UPI000E6F7759|nr:uncharacterized protein LOC113293190 isoform X2 [Papaver somniferum]
MTGVLHVGNGVHGLGITDSGDEKFEEGKVTKLMKKKGTSMVLVDGAGAGDIVSITGLATPSIAPTVASVEVCFKHDLEQLLQLCPYCLQQSATISSILYIDTTSLTLALQGMYHGISLRQTCFFLHFGHAMNVCASAKDTLLLKSNFFMFSCAFGSSATVSDSSRHVMSIFMNLLRTMLMKHPIMST